MAYEVSQFSRCHAIRTRFAGCKDFQDIKLVKSLQKCFENWIVFETFKFIVQEICRNLINIITRDKEEKMVNLVISNLKQNFQNKFSNPFKKYNNSAAV